MFTHRANDSEWAEFLPIQFPGQAGGLDEVRVQANAIARFKSRYGAERFAICFRVMVLGRSRLGPNQVMDFLQVGRCFMGPGFLRIRYGSVHVKVHAGVFSEVGEEGRNLCRIRNGVICCKLAHR